MPAAAGCSNCCTKYSLFTKEHGCPLCHLSFCKKCLTRRLRKPNNGEEIAVCTSCFQKATNPQPVAPPRHNRPGNSVTGGTGQGQPWWGEGLPPPSMRTQTNPAPWRQVNMVPQGYKGPVNAAAGPSGSSAQGSPYGKNPIPHPETRDLEEKLSELRKDLPENKQRALTVSEIEERLAALRGCDVELVRHPRTWFVSSSDCQPMESDTVEGLLKMASDRAKIEDNVDRDLEERYKRVRMRDEEATATSELKVEEPETDETDGAGTEDYRMSAASQDTAFSETTKAELAEIKEMMAAADERIRNARPTDEDVDREVKHTLADVRQKSIDIDKINREIGNYYMNRSRTDETELDSDEDTKSLTDEVLQRIIKEAEQTEHDEPVAKKREVQSTDAPNSEGTPKSPKSPGFFGRIFRK